MLEIRLLGQFALRRDGETLDLPSRPAQSLLAYLALNVGTTHRRERLAGLFWPAATEANARLYLRKALWNIRKALELNMKAKPHYLLADDLTVAFAADADYWLDVAQLEWKASEVTSVEDLLEATALYRGELLPGFYDEWVVSERERLQVIWEHKMKLLLDRLVAEQRWPEVLEQGELWIAVGKAPEAAYRTLMLAHHSLGDASSVTAVYQRCAESLRRELAVEPSAQMRSLYEQLRASAAAADDHAQRLVSLPKGNLPRQLTSFIGREQAVLEVRRLLTVSRLVTLVGAGGCGKTRLALQVAAELATAYSDGVWLVELAPVSDPALIPQSVAMALGLREGPGRSLLTALTDYVRTRELLLVMDTCEHLVDPCAQLAERLLRTAPLLRILATSREVLSIAGETSYDVPSLSLPDSDVVPPLESLAKYEAVRLFLERAVTALPTFTVTSQNAAAIVQVCRRLDGIPLAIELAAARVKMLRAEQIAVRLAERDRFHLLTGGSRTALPRHQTLRALIDWSYDLLSEAERALLCHLSVLAGRWTLEAAEAVAGAGVSSQGMGVLNLLTQLLNKSLVVAERASGQETHYHLLETIRAYALERLAERGDQEAWEKAAHYLIQTGDMATGQNDHVQARLHYSRAIESLGHLPDTEGNRRQRADALVKLVSVSIVAYPPELCLAYLAEAEGLARDLAGSEASGKMPDQRRLVHIYYWMGRAHYSRGAPGTAIHYFQQVVAEGPGFEDTQLLVAPSASIMVRVINLQGRFAEAGVRLVAAVPLVEKIANWPDWIFTVGHLGLSLAARGQYEAGLAAGERALVRAGEINNATCLAFSHLLLTVIAVMGGDLQRALGESRLCVGLAEQSADRLYIVLSSGVKGWAESRLGLHATARASMAYAKSIGQTLGRQILLADWLAAIEAEIALGAGQVEEALGLAEKAVAVARSMDGIFAQGLAQRVQGQALALLNPMQREEAEAHLAESLHAFNMGGAVLESARTQVAWGGVYNKWGDPAAARDQFEKAIAQFEASGVKTELVRTRALLLELG